MDLFPLRTTGTAARPLDVVVVRELTQGDVEQLNLPRSYEKSPLKRLSTRHHALARCLADGMTQIEASLVTGYTTAGISLLLTDPSFKELVRHYQDKKDASFVDLHDRLAGMAIDIHDELRDRLEEIPEDWTIGQLMEMLKLSADRSGHGPTERREVDVNIGLAERLERARKRVIDITPGAKDAA